MIADYFMNRSKKEAYSQLYGLIKLVDPGTSNNVMPQNYQFVIIFEAKRKGGPLKVCLYRTRSRLSRRNGL